MSRWAGDQGAGVEDDREVERLLGPARLAYFTPVREYPPLGDRKSLTMLTLNGLMMTVMYLFAEEIHAVLHGNLVVKWLAIVVGLLVVLAPDHRGVLRLPGADAANPPDGRLCGLLCKHRGHVVGFLPADPGEALAPRRDARHA